MYVAGIHVKEDLFSENDSYKSAFEDMGFEVDCPYILFKGRKYPKSLGFYEEIRKFFIKRIKRSIEIMKFY